MTPRRRREQLKVSILEAQRMLSLVGDHPTMGPSFRKRVEMMQRELDDLPADTKEASVTLLFSGAPVLGSIGIDANFLSRVLLPFQKMIQSDLVQRGYGKVGSRGQLKNADEARLFLTSLPRGSFGVELSKLDSNNLFNEDQVADSLVHVSRLVDAAARSDEDFAASLSDTSSRTLSDLTQFLKVVADDKAGISIETGNARSALSNSDVLAAYQRVSETRTELQDVEISGTLKGILLESWKFDFLAETGETITGAIGPEISEEEAAQIFSEFFNRKCTAMFQKTSVYLRSGRVKEIFVLLGVKG